MKTFNTLSELTACIGQEVAVSDWITITQQQVNQFAEATGDHQWIHVDVEKAKTGPFGGPIAHGFLTLSLLPRFFESSLKIVGSAMGVNYGLNKGAFHCPRAGGQPPARPYETVDCRTDRQQRRSDELGSDSGARRIGQAGVRGRIASATLPLSQLSPGKWHACVRWALIGLPAPSLQTQRSGC